MTLDRWPALVIRVGMLLAAFVLGAVLFSGSDGPTVQDGAQDEVWTCSMHPQIRQPGSGDCPICGMDLIPLSDLDQSSSDRVVLSDRARTLAELRTTEVTRQADTSAQVRLLGRVEPDESTRKNVTTWIGGRIDRLHVNTTGEQIRRGQVIATLYSPEVYQAHQDLITARKQVARLASSPDSAREAARAALSAARERLRLLGVPAAEIDVMQAADDPKRSVAIRSPFAGTVIDRVATEGAYVETGAPLYRVADLGTLWVQLDAYESDLPKISIGQDVTIEVEGIPGRVFEGRVAFVDPTVDSQRRTARVRVEVKNPDGQLRPGMFAEAVVAATGGLPADAPLVIPTSAPLFTGKRSVVYVEVKNGDEIGYAPRTVRLGPRLGDVYPVVAGLSAGDRVVTRGAFVLDADLQIRGGPSMMTADDDNAPVVDEPVPLTSDQRAALAPVLEHYLDVQRALAEGDHASATAAASAVEDAVVAVALDAKGWSPVADSLRAHAQHVASSSNIEGAREGFEPLSLAIESMLRRFGNPLEGKVHVAYCPMAMGSEGARWVQQGDTIDNAYFGDAMRRCGEIRAAIEPGTYLGPPAGSPPANNHQGHDH